MNIDLWSFALGVMAVLVLFGLYERLYRQPRDAKRQAAVRQILKGFAPHRSAFARYVQEKYPEQYELFLLQLEFLEGTLQKEARWGTPLEPFRLTDFAKYYQAYLATTRTDGPRAVEM